MLLTILLVMFVVILLVWFLSLLGAVPAAPGQPNYSAWLPFFACLILGAAVFLFGSGVIVQPVGVVR